MTVPDALRGQTFGEGGADVVLADDFQQLVSHVAGQTGGSGQAQYDCGQHELLEVVRRVFQERCDAAERWYPTEYRNERDQHHRRNPEVRRGRGDNGEEPGNLVL